MNDLISRQAAIDAITSQRGVVDKSVAKRILIQLPSAQPEQKTGYWQITDSYPHNVYCSECHTKFAQTHWAVWEDGSLPRKFCPNCGAKMEE